MKRHYTIMLIPDRESSSFSLKLPKFVIQGALLLLAVIILLLSIFAYDYFKLLNQVYQNKHLTLENQQLKEQVQIFQVKINTLAGDLERIYNFERKLRVLTGLDQLKENMDQDELQGGYQKQSKDRDSIKKDPLPFHQHNDHLHHHDLKNLKHKEGSNRPIFLQENMNKLKKLTQTNEYPASDQFQEKYKLYQQKLASHFGVHDEKGFNRTWFDLTQKSLELANEYAFFDYKFDLFSSSLMKLEARVHQIMYLLVYTFFLFSIFYLIFKHKSLD